MRIQIRGLSARYQRPKRTLYRELSADFPEGSTTGLFGPNGVGKSTLLRLIARLDDGLISNAREAIRWGKPDAYVSYVPQSYSSSLMPWFSIDENIALPLTARNGMQDSAILERCKKLKEHFQISYPQEMTSALSGGQQQTIVLLRSVIRMPELLLLDEPFSALDVYTGAQFRESYFRYIHEEGITTIFVTHDLSECVRFSDRILFLRKEPAEGETDSGHTKPILVEFGSSHRIRVLDPAYLKRKEEEISDEIGGLALQ